MVYGTYNELVFMGHENGGPTLVGHCEIKHQGPKSIQPGIQTETYALAVLGPPLPGPLFL